MVKNVSTVPAWLRDEAVPYSLPIIVRKEKTTSASHEDVLRATGAALTRMLLSEDAVNDAAWSVPLKAWMTGRIRKVSRRARASEWTKALTGPHFVASYGEAEVAVLPPHETSSVPENIRRLQVSGLDLPFRDSPQTVEGRVVFEVAFTPEVEMTTGKSVAQMGHVVQLLLTEANDDVISALSDSDPLFVFTEWDSEEAWDVSVVDAGFTEIPAGTETVRGRIRK